jgi:23S rRNA pseudouridine955/2504/2580 synthase
LSSVEHKVVGDDEAGLRLDRWFKHHYPGLAYARLSKLLRTGQIRLDGSRVKAGQRLEAGQNVRVPPLGELKPAHKPKVKTEAGLSKSDRARAEAMLIYKDARILALNKEPGLPTQGGSGQRVHVDRLLEALKFKAPERPRLVHRLDKDTSGVLLLARDRKAAVDLTKVFRTRECQKIYWALVIGVPREASGRVDLAIEKQLGRGGERMNVSQDGKAAVTYYRVVEAAGRKAAWVALRPLTGRTHQLRVHMAAVGHPIVGDGKYGGAEAFLSGSISKNLHLHARSIRMLGLQSATGDFEVAAPLPRHMAESWEFLGFEEAAAAEAELALKEIE